jgi:hypothetical protein
MAPRICDADLTYYDLKEHIANGEQIVYIAGFTRRTAEFVGPLNPS